MILTCPSCETHYFAEDASIGEAGKHVRCAACGHSWHVQGQGKDIVGGRPSHAHQAMRDKIRARRIRLHGHIARVSWALGAVLFLGLLGGGVLWRDYVVRIWPQSAGAFKLAGFDVNRFGLEFVEQDAARTFDGTVPILTVTGTAENITERPLSAPVVLVRLRDEDGKEVARVAAALEPRTIPAGGRGQFSTILESPPVEAFDLELSFAEENVLADAGVSVRVAHTRERAETAGGRDQ